MTPAVLLLAAVFASPGAFAVGTVAGTDINNAASVSYQLGTTPVTDTSNTVTVTVAVSAAPLPSLIVYV